MNLFDIIPENLFSVLSSPNKKIYINALFVIKECFLKEMSVPRDDIARAIASKIEDELLQIQKEDEDEKIENSITDRAYYILRRLKEVGWIETEIEDRSFEENVILPDYTIEILNLLYSLMQKKNLEYNSYAYQTYATLKIAVNEEHSRLYDATLLAYENAYKLQDALKSLQHNLGRYYRKIFDLPEINSILQEHFENYKEYIDRIYHPLKIDDPVELYKIPICRMIDKIMGVNSIFEELLQQANKSGNYENLEDAKSDMYNKLNDIQDIFININKKIKIVDNKNTEYIVATNRKIGYLLTSDKELKGKLINILKNSMNGNNIELMNENLNLYAQSYVNKESIFLRSSKNEKRQGKPLEIETIQIESTEELKEFIERVQNSYTSEKVNNYMNNIFKGKDIIKTNDVQINSEEDFILLMLGTMSEERNNYTIEYNGQTVQKGKYRMPDMIIRRRGLK